MSKCHNVGNSMHWLNYSLTLLHEYRVLAVNRIPFKHIYPSLAVHRIPLKPVMGVRVVTIYEPRHEISNNVAF